MRQRLLLYGYEAASFLIPSGAVFASARALLREVGEMDALEATIFALSFAAFVGMLGLTAFRRWGIAWARVGPLRLDIRSSGRGRGVSVIDYWGLCRWYQLGDLLIVSRESDEVVLRLRIPSYFARRDFRDWAEPIGAEHCLYSAIQVASSAGTVPHLPTEIVIGKRGYVRGHVDLICEIGGPSEGEPSREEFEEWMDDGHEPWKLVIEDLISRRRLVVSVDDLPNVETDTFPWDVKQQGK